MAKITTLSKGDLFKFDFPFGRLHRFHSLSIESDGRLLIYLMGVNFEGNINNAHSNSFTWRDCDVDVFVPRFYLCESKKTRGVPCLPVGVERLLLPNNLNEVNLSDKYCNGKEYWYDYVNQ